jgi:hypothetical protein
MHIHINNYTFIAVWWLMLFPVVSPAQHTNQINPQYLTGQWEAWWVTHPHASLYDYGVFHFRKTFELDQLADTFFVHVSADNRYRLFINGVPVCYGPARGDFGQWFYETVDIAPFLKRGKNVLAAMVWNAGEFKPKAQVSDKTAFIIQGNTAEEQIVNSGTGWKVIQNHAYSPILYKDIDDRLFRQYYVAGPLDSVVAQLYPYGWEHPGFDDSAWLEVRLLDKPSRQHTYHHKWTMEPRQIPLFTNAYKRFKRIARTNINIDQDQFFAHSSPIIVPPNSRATILFDNGVQTNGYPEIKISDGDQSQIHIRYAETFILPGLVKGHRDSLQTELVGVKDVFVPNGMKSIVFRPLWTRTFRWLQLEIETHDQPLTIHDLRYEYAAYPTEIKASFNSDDPILTKIWDASIRTQSLSAQETFVSDLYWEQMQYIGDTKVQGLAYLFMTGDEHLYKLALQQFDNSRLPIGLTQSRYPSDLVQVIPLYSLVWVTMVHDYWMYGKDPDYVKQYLPGIIAVLEWFENQINGNYLIPQLPLFDFVDWAYAPRQEEIAQLSEKNESTVHSLFYAYALKNAVEIFKWAGQNYHANYFDSIRTRLNEAVKTLCYDEKEGLYADTPSRKLFSQHTNIMAVLADFEPKKKEQEIIKKVITSSELLEVDMYFHFYLGRAIKKSGMGNAYLQTIESWRKFIDLGMTTFGEAVNEPRSECHAWSTGPAFEFLSTVCGVESQAPGFKKIEIAPHLGDLKQVRGEIAHPEGLITIDLTKNQQGTLAGSIEIPNNTSGVFIFQGKKIDLIGGKRLVLD